jgi:hypothetical protein
VGVEATGPQHISELSKLCKNQGSSHSTHERQLLFAKDSSEKNYNFQWQLYIRQNTDCELCGTRPCRKVGSAKTMYPSLELCLADFRSSNECHALYDQPCTKDHFLLFEAWEDPTQCHLE